MIKNSRSLFNVKKIVLVLMMNIVARKVNYLNNSHYKNSFIDFYSHSYYINELLEDFQKDQNNINVKLSKAS